MEDASDLVTKQANDRSPDSPATSVQGGTRLVSSLSRQLAQTVGANLLLALLAFGTGPLAARLLGPDGRGELAAIQTVPSFIASLAMLGLPDAVVYFSARGQDQAGRFWASASAITLLAGPLFIGAGYLIMPLALSAQSASTIASARWYLLLIPVYALMNMSLQPLRGRHDLVAWNAFRLAPGLCWLAILVYATTTGGEAAPGWLSARFLAAQGLLIVPVVLVVARRIPGPFVPRVDSFRPMLKYGLPSMIGSVPKTLNRRLDQMLMAALVGPQALGLYAVAATWSSAMAPVLTAFGQVAFPSVAVHTSDEGKARLVLLTSRLASLAAVCLTVILYAVTPFCLPLIFGADFEPSVPSAQILVVAAAFLGVGLVLEDTLRGLGDTRAVLKSESIGLVFTLIFLAALLPPLGIVGAALASVVGYSATTFILIHYVKGHLGCGYFSVIVPTSIELDLLRKAARKALSR